MLTVDGLTVSYGGILAVRGASVNVADGAITCLIGRNGSGKSSLVNALAGLVPSHGEIKLDGTQISGRSPAFRARNGLSLVPENRRIFGQLSVEENLMLGAPKDKQQARQRLDHVLTVFPDLSGMLRRGGHQISGGQQQMVAIGRALMCGPRVLILDEPSLGLAPIVVDKVLTAVAMLAAAGQAVFLIEQNAHSALAISAHAYAMALGEVRQLPQGTVSMDDEELRSLYL